MHDSTSYWSKISNINFPTFSGIYPTQTGKMNFIGALYMIQYGSKAQYNLISKLRYYHSRNRDAYVSLKKEQVQHISIHVTGYKENKRLEKNIMGYTGLLLVEFDEKENPNFSTNDIKEILKNYPFVATAYNSVSGRGVHAWVMADQIIDRGTYKAAFQSLKQVFSTEYNLNVDTKANGITQLVAMSLDQCIYINEGVIPYRFEYIPSNIPQGKSIGIGSKVDMSDFILDEKFYSESHYKYIKHTYTESFTMFSVESNLPVSYCKNLRYNPDQHYFAKHASQEMIGQCHFYNENRSMGTNEIPFSQFKIVTSGKRIIRDGNRKKVLIRLLCDFAFLKQLSGMRITKSQIYSLALLFSKTICYDRSGTYKSPLCKNSLKLICISVWDKVVNAQLQPEIRTRRTIFNSGLKDIHPGLNFKQAYRKEWTLLQGKLHSHIVRNNVCAIYALVENGEVRIKSKADVYRWLMLKYSVCYDTCKNWVEKVLEQEKKEKVQQSGNPGKYIFPSLSLLLSKNTHLLYQMNKIMKGIKELSSDGHKITQKTLAHRTGLHVNTVKNYWPQIKTDINNLNQQLALWEK